MSCFASACASISALADPAVKDIWVPPNELKDLAVIRSEDRTAIDSGLCAMALLRAVEINNYFHSGFKDASTIQDRSVGTAANISQFDCYADPDGKPLFYLEMTLTLKVTPISPGGKAVVTRYFTFNNRGELEGWLL